MDALLQDMRYAVRRLRVNPGLVAIVALSLGFGIGGVTTMFSVVYAVDFRPLPYRDPNRLVAIREIAPPQFVRCRDCYVSGATFTDWQQQSTTFAAMVAQRTYVRRWWRGVEADETEHLTTADVSPNLLSMLGVRPLLGRDLVVSDQRPDAQPVVLLSHDLWQRHFGADPRVLGRQLTFIAFGTEQRQSYTIVGVMPAGFRFFVASAWMPLRAGVTELRSDRSLQVFGRLKSGVTILEANTELATISRRLSAEYPETHRGWGARAIELRDALTQDFGPVGAGRFVLAALVACVLAIAMTNVAGVQLVRAEERRAESAIQMALGAPRARIGRSFLFESTIVALMGGAVGLMLATFGVRLTAVGLGLERLGIPVAVDFGVFTFALGASLLTGLACGIVPWSRASRMVVLSALREVGRSGRGGNRRSVLSRALVASQIALALMLLTGAGILSKDLDWLRHNAPGYDASGLYQVTARMGKDAREDPARRRQLASTLVEYVARTPGVVGASVGSVSFVRPNVRFEDQAAATPSEARPLLMGVGPAFFEVVGTRILVGRPFSSLDRNGAVPVAIVNEAAVAALWAGKSAIGSRLTLTDSVSAEPVTVVGVAADSKLSDPRLGLAAPPIIYRPYDQSPEQQLVVFARTGTMASSIRLGLHAALKQVTSGPIDQNDIVAMSDIVERELVQKRFNQLALAAFAVFGLVLASVGVYGVVAYSVVQRTQEIGVRVALGARRADVVRLVTSESAALAALGMLFGLAAAFALAQILRSTLVGTSPTDPMVFGASSLLLAGVTTLASCIPVWRATRVDPAVALRGENM